VQKFLSKYIEHRSNHRLESRDEWTPSPHPNLGATASAQGRLIKGGPCPRQGRRGNTLSEGSKDYIAWLRQDARDQKAPQGRGS
jgi:hypothetical protein